MRAYTQGLIWSKTYTTAPGVSNGYEWSEPPKCSPNAKI